MINTHSSVTIWWLHLKVNEGKAFRKGEDKLLRLNLGKSGNEEEEAQKIFLRTWAELILHSLFYRKLLLPHLYCGGITQENMAIQTDRKWVCLSHSCLNWPHHNSPGESSFWAETDPSTDLVYSRPNYWLQPELRVYFLSYTGQGSFSDIDFNHKNQP